MAIVKSNDLTMHMDADMLKGMAECSRAKMLYNGRKIAHNSEKEGVKERIFCLTHFPPFQDSSTG